ncbi:RNA 2'-phosphotransferase [Terricaulis sp.]|uniref:RNA 2'-phosphotransferase n=1 Tax=Terricaulis sp. TaxID=2768686 RepID=UPI0037847CBC
MADHVRISKTLSYWLRHKPESAGLALSADGWADVDAVLAALAAQNQPGDVDTLLAVVETNDKQRFELSPDLARIRARQGHSIEIELALAPVTPPNVLYHGTVERFLAAIMADGLRRMGRHHVHLSAELETARRVGARRGDPVILIVDAAAMARDGHVFFVTGNGVWLTEQAPAAYLKCS